MHDEGTEQTAGWLKRYSRLKDARAVWDTTAQEIAEYVAPRKAGITQSDYTPNNQRDAFLYDTTAKNALERAVAGYMSWTTSKTAPWFEFTPVLEQRKNLKVQRWLRECSELGAEYIASSNFYTERHEALFDKWAFGTDCLFSQVTPEGRTHFEKIRFGSYVFEADAEGKPYAFFRELELTAKQAEMKFGKESLPKCITECLESNADKKFIFIHVVEPRDKKDQGDGTGFTIAQRKPILSAYVEQSSKKIVQMGGFNSFPFHIGRFLKWDAVNNGADVWGYGPGFTLLPEGRQLNFLSKMMDVYAEKSVFPPMLVPDTFEGALKTAARATNYYPSSMGSDGIIPIPMAGDWQIAMDRIKRREDIINTSVYLDMFQMFSMNAMRNREMTAYEASQLASEKLDAISPAFDRDSSEVIEPMTTRLFEEWAENGMLPPPPEEAAIQEGNFIRFPNPNVLQIGRLALALQSISMRNDDALVQSVLTIAPLSPDILDTIDLTKYAQRKAMLTHASPDILRSQEDIDAMRQARAQQQQAQAAAMMAKETAGAIKDVGGVEQAKQLMGA